MLLYHYSMKTSPGSHFLLFSCQIWNAFPILVVSYTSVTSWQDLEVGDGPLCLKSTTSSLWLLGQPRGRMLFNNHEPPVCCHDICLAVAQQKAWSMCGCTSLPGPCNRCPGSHASLVMGPHNTLSSEPPSQMCLFRWCKMLNAGWGAHCLPSVVAG